MKCINVKGHISFGILAASVFCWYTQATIIETGIIVAASIPGSIILDIDHRQATANKPITPFSLRQQKALKRAAILCALVGVFLLLLNNFSTQTMQWIPEWILNSSVIWLLVAGLLWLLSRFRDMVLFIAGAGITYCYVQYGLHWFIAVLGVCMFILPILKHRGLLHTPEFVGCLVLALLTYAETLGVEILLLSALGISIGMVSHLIADSLGPEGIKSLLFPKLRLALQIVPAGSRTESIVSYASWAGSLAVIFISKL